MGSLDFMAFAFVRSAKALRDIRVRVADGWLELEFKAYKGFTPCAIQGVAVVLDVLTDEGPREIRGSLNIKKISAPRGAWYKYRFMPENPNEFLLVVERDDLYSNVSKVRLVSPHGSLELKNSFCFEPFEAVPV